jgi:hypothetical protein
MMHPPWAGTYTRDTKPRLAVTRPQSSRIARGLHAGVHFTLLSRRLGPVGFLHGRSLSSAPNWHLG